MLFVIQYRKSVLLLLAVLLATVSSVEFIISRSKKFACLTWFTLAMKAETETSYFSVSSCASFTTGLHFEVCDVSSTAQKQKKRRKKKERSVTSISASVEHPLALPSPFSWFTLERKDSSVSVFMVHTRT